MEVFLSHMLGMLPVGAGVILLGGDGVPRFA
jgi:hypothetical protein